jgi:flagellar biosynthesis GTPase FlhF
VHQKKLWFISRILATKWDDPTITNSGEIVTSSNYFSSSYLSSGYIQPPFGLIYGLVDDYKFIVPFIHWRLSQSLVQTNPQKKRNKQTNKTNKQNKAEQDITTQQTNKQTEKQTNKTKPNKTKQTKTNQQNKTNQQKKTKQTNKTNRTNKTNQQNKTKRNKAKQNKTTNKHTNNQTSKKANKQTTSWNDVDAMPKPLLASFRLPVAIFTNFVSSSKYHTHPYNCNSYYILYIYIPILSHIYISFTIPYAQCMEYLPTFARTKSPSFVG